MEIQKFLLEVDEELSRIVDDYGLKSKRTAFEVFCGSLFIDRDELKVIEEHLIGGKGDNKLDLGQCEAESDINILAQVKHSDDPQKMTFGIDVVEEILTSERRLNDINSTGSKKWREFKKKFKNSDNKPIRKLLILYGTLSKEGWKYAVENKVEVYDLERLKEKYVFFNSSMGSLLEPKVLLIPINETGMTHREKNSISTSTVYSPIKIIYDFIKKHGHSAFIDDLRNKMDKSAKLGIYSNIYSTVVNETERLLDRNNGLVIACSDLQINYTMVDVEHEGKMVKEKVIKSVQLIMPQIINGAQSSWALFDACQSLISSGREEELLEEISVKITTSTSKEYLRNTAHTTNLQNHFKPRDARSNDPEQIELNTAFNKYIPKVFYNHQEGMLSILKDRKELPLYQIGKKVREINNEEAGQLYFALLGLPQYSKNKKQSLFTTDVYNTIYKYHLDEEERFNNEALGISTKDIYLRSGNIDYFVQDIIFAKCINKFTEAYKRCYTKKLEVCNERNLNDVKEYIKYWNYFVVASIHYIIERLCQGAKDPDSDRERVRSLLIGEDINIYWKNDLWKVLEIDKGHNYQILNGSNPSSNRQLFILCHWVHSLDDIFFNIISSESEKSSWKSFRDFFELRSDSFNRVKKEIDKIIGGPPIKKQIAFPTSMSNFEQLTQLLLSNN